MKSFTETVSAGGSKQDDRLTGKVVAFKESVGVWGLIS